MPYEIRPREGATIRAPEPLTIRFLHGFRDRFAILGRVFSRRNGAASVSQADDVMGQNPSVIEYERGATSGHVRTFRDPFSRM
jgi:hypothetical protein